MEAVALLQTKLVPRSPFGRDKSNLFKLASMIMKKPLAMCRQTKVQTELAVDHERIVTMR